MPEKVTPLENGDIGKKGKALNKTKGVESPSPRKEVREIIQRTAKELYNKLLKFEGAPDDSDEEEEEEDETFEGPQGI